MSRTPGRCRHCGQPIYLNMHPERQVDVYVHTDTRSRWCSVHTDTTAQPEAA